MRCPDLVLGMCRAGLALIFGYAGIQKLRDPAPTAEFLAAMVRLDVAPGVVMALGAAEIILALALFAKAADRLTARAALVASSVFLTFHALTLTRDTPAPPCGCMGAAVAETPLHPGWWVAFTGAMIVASGALLLASPRAASPAHSGAEADHPAAPLPEIAS
ncbi:MAG: DoxX family membrane protein [Phycisphaeraceae bacterium]|nr:DoxX family membrane protein [Phycisphaeraceae bacterium]